MPLVMAFGISSNVADYFAKQTGGEAVRVYKPEDYRAHPEVLSRFDTHKASSSARASALFPAISMSFDVSSRQTINPDNSTYRNSAADCGELFLMTAPPRTTFKLKCDSWEADTVSTSNALLPSPQTK